jgi:hypothetical protein
MKLLCLVAAACLVASAASPKRDWKTGMLTDLSSERVLAGFGGPLAYTTPGGLLTGHPAVYATVQRFVIVGEGMEWTVELQRDPGFARRPNLTVNGPLKYALEPAKPAGRFTNSHPERFYLLDADNREWQTTVLEKKLLAPPPLPAK